MIGLRDGCVRNVVGGDPLQPDNLFVYGDCDGNGCQARLQHPLDVKFLRLNDADTLLIADSYNNALKLVDLKTKYCRKLRLSEANSLSEPNCVWVETDGRVWIADTNNHVIKIIEDLNELPCCSVRNFSVDFDDSAAVVRSLKDMSFEDDGGEGVFLKISEELKNINLNGVNSWNLVIRKGGLEIIAAYSGGFGELNEYGKRGIYRLACCDLDPGRIENIELEVNFVYCCGVDAENVCRMFKKRLVFERDEIESLLEKSRKELSELRKSLLLQII